MKIIIPMAGAGSRFVEAGYKTNKAALPLVYRKDGHTYPMVVCAVKDLPDVEPKGENVAFIMRNFHYDLNVDDEIKKEYTDCKFFSVENLTEGQACTCMLAESFIDDDDSLLIAACDNGIQYDYEKFHRLTDTCDMLVFTYRHNPKVYDNPDSFGWVYIDGEGYVSDVSVKKHISDTPEEDHAIVATFWFRNGKIFKDATNKMIAENDRVNGEFYVDEVIKHVLALGYKVRVFEMERFLNYGTPEDYENYHKTIEHFKSFLSSGSYLGE